MEEIIADSVKNKIIADIKQNHEILRNLKYLNMDSLHGDIDSDITNYVASIKSEMFSFKNDVSGNITVLTKKGCENDEKLKSTIDKIISTVGEHNANFSFDEYMTHLKKNLYELSDEEIKKVQKKKKDFIFEELEKPYFRQYLGITNEEDEKKIEIEKKVDEEKKVEIEKVKEFKERFEFDENKIYPDNNTSFSNEKTFFLSDRDNKLSCMNNGEQKNIQDCNFDNIPNYMPEYKANSEQYDEENGKPKYPEDIKKKALFLSKFRMGILGDATLIKDYVKNSMYYIGEAHFSNNSAYFPKEDIKYYNENLRDELKFNPEYNKLFIQQLAMRNLIFPISLKMVKTDNPFKKLSDYKRNLKIFIEKEKKENAEQKIDDYNSDDIHAILYYKLKKKGNKEGLFIFYIIKNRINKSSWSISNYNIFNSWGNQTYFTKSDIPSHVRVQYIELNIVYHLLKSKGNIYFYKIKNDNMILVSRYTLNTIRDKYRDMRINMEELGELEELCNHKLTNRNGISLFQWQIKDLSNNPWRIKKGKPDPQKPFISPDEFFNLVSSPCKQFKNTNLEENKYFYDKYLKYAEAKGFTPSSNTYESKYLKYKNKYLKLKSSME